MAENSKIEWTDHTFNPWRGCTKVAQGCTNCYAEAMSKRNPGVLGVWGPDGTRVVAAEAMWRKPLKWNEDAMLVRGLDERLPRPRVFCGSMCDVFEDRPELVEPRNRLYRLIQDTPELDWLILTKRPEMVTNWCQDTRSRGRKPLPNIWLGTSVACQEDLERNIPELLKVPATVHFVSYEPAVGPVNFRWASWDDWSEEGGERRQSVNHLDGLRMLDWVIVGGESGPNARPFDVAWARSTVEQCKAAGVPVFVKQMGAFPAGEVVNPKGGPSHVPLEYRSKKGADMQEWPEDLRVREFPEVTA